MLSDSDELRVPRAQLESHSAPVEGTGSLEDLVAYYARVSNHSAEFGRDSRRLLRYLIDHKHWSPFEMVNVVLRVTTTRDIARQLLRHRSFSFQEFSQRYAKVERVSQLRECRMQDRRNRQNSLPSIDSDLDHTWAYYQDKVVKQAQEAYEWATANGIAKEVARAVLPEGLTDSTLIVNGTLRSWIHYIQIRTDPATQKEHRELALACAEAIEPVFPMIEEFTHGS